MSKFQIGKILINRNEVLGKGSHGTIVYRGTFDGTRDVAIKQVSKKFFEWVKREVDHLLQTDLDKNVVRYFCKEEDDDFYYIALERCECTLQNYMERPAEFPNITVKEILQQITSGLRFLHSVDIIHRDIRPQNILFSKFKENTIVKISDFGFSKELSGPRSSEISIAMSSSQCWSAPEVINNNRCNKSSDVFSLGLVFHYVITGGVSNGCFTSNVTGRTLTIQNYNLNLHQIDSDRTCDNILMKELISNMVKESGEQRFTIEQVFKDPYFWDLKKILDFTTDISNRMEKRDSLASTLLYNLEDGASSVVNGDWMSVIDSAATSDLLNFRRYNGGSVCDLIRGIRNKKAHYDNMSQTVKDIYGPLPEKYMQYWVRKFPYLVHQMYRAAKSSGLQNEENLKIYF